MEKYDVIVIGGGFAGSAAALAAARGGAKVMLIERINCLGGAPATQYINPFMKYSTQMPDGTKYLSRGIFEELVNAMRDMGAMYNNSFNPEYLKLILDRKMVEAGVELLYNTTLVSAKREGNTVKSVAVTNKSGVTEYEADYFIDCTGDADLAYDAGFECKLGRPEDNLCQPMTLCFLIGGVDPEKFEKYHYGIVDLWLDEKKKGKIKNPMDGIMVFHSTIPGIVRLNATRVVKRNPVDAKDVTLADIEAREQCFELLEFLRNRVDGFQNANIISTAPQTGVRESRMIVGEYVLTCEDLVNCVKFDDAIACGNYDIDIHNPEGSGTNHYFFKNGLYYTIPYRCLIPKGADNLLVAGRCISTTHEAQASIRIMAIVCTLGEAAGTAAAIAKKTSSRVADISIGELRSTLKSNNACVD